MERLIGRACGLDVHEETVAACVRVPGALGAREQHVRIFGTMAAELLALRDWLEAHGVTPVAMESTGVYWKPVFSVLEEAFTCLLVNAAHVKQVPGRKTDVQDGVWIAQLLEHGLLRGSFVPPAPIRELRDLTRYRTALIQERTRAATRLHKLLQDAGIKLASVATDVLGVSGRAMLEALVHGTTDPAVLAELARGRLRAKLPALRQALAGRFRAHHAFLLSQLLAHLDYLDEAIATLSARVEEVIAPFADEVARLDTLSGSTSGPPRRSSRRSAWTCASFPATGIWPAGRGCVRGTTRVPGSTRRGNPARGTAGCGRRSSKRPWRPSAPRTARWRPATGASCAIEVTTRPWSPSRMPFSARPTGSWRPGSPIRILARPFDRRHAARLTRRAVRLLERQGYHVTLEQAA